MLNRLFSLNRQREQLLKKAPEGALKNFLSEPFPEPSLPINQVALLAVDFETTGLNLNKDKILSVGFVGIENSEILLSTACHKIIHTKEPLVEENVVIHQITDSAREQGETLEIAINNLLDALAGKVMLAHYARIEKHFLERACRKLYGLAPVFPIIDTLAIAKRRMDRQTTVYNPSELRLPNLRAQHGLPAHHAHNALSDALATAELLMAEIEIMKSKEPPSLKKLLL